MRLDDVVDEAGIEKVDLLKIDIEGAEYEVLESFAGLESVRTIVGEVHPELMSSSVRDFTTLLHGFRCDLPPVVSSDTNFRADRIPPRREGVDSPRVSEPGHPMKAQQ